MLLSLACGCRCLWHRCSPVWLVVQHGYNIRFSAILSFSVVSRLGWRTGYLIPSALAGEGLITYMRTDGLQISEEALAQVRDTVAANFGPDYVPKAARIYKCAASCICLAAAGCHLSP